MEDIKKLEMAVLRKFGFRWAVLASWAAKLRNRGAEIPEVVTRMLEEAQIKISSGCFSSCSVGCALNKVEGTLLSIDGSMADNEVDYWTGLIGDVMSDKVDAEKVLGVPGVKVHYSSCFSTGCDCSK